MAVDFKPLTLTPVEFSLTDGTQIPAPLDSPPVTPVKSGGLSTLDEGKANEENQNPANGGGNSKRPHNLNISTPDSKLAPLTPLSPTSADSQQSRQRPLGVRKFLSLRSLRGESRRHRGGELSPTGTEFAYDGAMSSRPGSPYTTETAISGETAQSSKRQPQGWFASATGRRKSQMFVIGRLDERLAAKSASPEQQKPKGPPPPTIPEFSLGNELEMGGDDLFKNI